MLAIVFTMKDTSGNNKGVTASKADERPAVDAAPDPSLSTVAGKEKPIGKRFSMALATVLEDPQLTSGLQERAGARNLEVPPHHYVDASVQRTGDNARTSK
jgi:hypothetical protein